MTSKRHLGNIVFLGAGNMSEALVKGLIGSGVCFPKDILMIDVKEDRIAHFQREFGVDGAVGQFDAVRRAAIVVLAIKPQAAEEVFAGIRDGLNPDALVVSIMAGVPTARIEKALGGQRRVVRSMPNTPALVRAGAAAICGGRYATEKDLDDAETMLQAVGVVVRLKEEDMDAVTALSGSGPAYVFYLIESMLEAAKKLNLADDVARRLIHATVDGAARLVTETGVDAEELRRRVTSKGGTTAAAVGVLDDRGVRGHVVDAIVAAHRRSGELSKH